MNLQKDLAIIALEPQAEGNTLVEARSADGIHVMILLRLTEPLAVGGRLTLTLGTQGTASSAPVMRERMQARVNSSLASAAPSPRLAATHAPSQSPSAGGDTPSLLLSTILGVPSRNSDTERNVDAELDALLGAPRKG
jgi:hypothetical protein